MAFLQWVLLPASGFYPGLIGAGGMCGIQSGHVGYLAWPHVQWSRVMSP